MGRCHRRGAGRLLLGEPLRAGLLDGPDQSVTSPLAVPGLAGLVLVTAIAALSFSQLAVLVDVASLVMRFRRARGTERQQLRWVAMAAGLLVAAVFQPPAAVSRRWWTGTSTAAATTPSRRFRRSANGCVSRST